MFFYMSTFILPVHFNRVVFFNKIIVSMRVSIFIEKLLKKDVRGEFQMKLSRFSKKVIAIVCSVAMVVAGLVFVPTADTKADAPDWSTIDYLGDGAGGGTYSNKYKFYAENGTQAVNIQHPGFAEEDGIYIGFPAADISMDLAGYAVQGAGACIYLSNFTNKVTEFTVSWAGGSTTCYVYYEDGAEGPTTTQDPSAPTAEPTTANPWKSIPNGGSQWYYNNTTKQNISNVVNIQKPGWAAEDGVYITVPAGISQVDVNGVTTGVAAIDGAGFVVYLSAMTKKINEVTVTQGLGTSYIQIKNENGSDDPTTEEPTEAPTGETETPTEAPTVEPTTEAPQDEWISANDRWLHVKSNGSVVAEGGNGDYNEVQGITAFYAGTWGHADIDVATSILDENELLLNVKSPGYGDAWSAQCHINKTLDPTKVYTINLYWGDTVIYTDASSYESSYQKTIDLNNLLSVGEDVLKVEFVEQEQPPEPPVVQDITITPNDAQITANHNIWATWTNPTGTTKAYVYLESVADGHSAIAANNWDFNVQAGQPMVGVDQVNHTRDNSIQVTEGQTYTLIVVSYNEFQQQTGYGEVSITIPGLTPEEQEIQEYMAKINTSDNLAYQKTPVVAEGNNEGTAGNFCDGNKDSRWQANKTIDNTWFAVDLEGYYNVDKVLVSWEASNATSYSIYTAGLDGVYGSDPIATVSGLENNHAVIKLSKNLDADARYVKVVVTGWSGNAEAYGISPYELAVFGEEIEGYYDVSTYKSATPYTHPERENMLFAGWFTDSTCTTAYTETTGVAYAKFIDEDILGPVKFQEATDGTAIRFLSSLDNAKYQEAGFIINGHYGTHVFKGLSKPAKTLYKSVKAEDETVLPTIFSQDSQYFFTYTVGGFTDFTDLEFNITPYIVTLDGTTVTGAVGTYPPAS